MAFGLQVRDAFGGVTFDSNSFSVRLIYQTTQSVGSNGGTISLPGFDSTKGVAWARYTDFQSSPTYTVNANSITIGFIGATRNVTVYALMFS